MLIFLIRREMGLKNDDRYHNFTIIRGGGRGYGQSVMIEIITSIKNEKL